ncbi:MAG: hypothetical protein ACYDH6_16075 [Acidimicrobiales bacterium]
MIVDTILAPILVVLTALFSALPTFSLLGTLGVSMSAIGTLGQSMSLVNPVFPVSETLTWCVIAYGLLLPLFVTYKVANWVYRHLPEILGFGPGGGG